MPWIMMPDGEKKYVLSKYAKEELPTWSEVYHEYYQENADYYDPLKDTELDHYWKIPRKKVLLATVCNQFNKMLYEEHHKDSILKELNRRYSAEEGEIIDIKFLLEPFDGEDYLDDWIKFIHNKFVGLNCAPPIYNIPHPKGIQNPFIVIDYARVDINTLDGELMLYPILVYKYGPNETGVEEYYPTDIDPRSIHMRKEIISYMMEQFCTYFEQGVGWKDRDGKIIESKQTYHPAGDPAL